MKTTRTKRRRAAPSQTPGRAILVRDLLRPIYSVGQPTGEPLVTDLATALKKAAGESFYLAPGDDRLYHVFPAFYCSSGVPVATVEARLRAVFPPPPEAPGL
jgi:hypothetical protein